MNDKNPFKRGHPDSSSTLKYKNTATSKKLKTSTGTGSKLKQKTLSFISASHATKNTTCKECKLDYNKANHNEVVLHRGFHDLFLKSFLFSDIKAKDIVNNNSDNERIIQISSSSCSSLQKKALVVWKYVNNELGVYSQHRNDDDSFKQDLFKPGIKVFIYLSSTSKAIGCIATEPISEAFRCLDANIDSGNSSDSIDDELVKCEKTPISPSPCCGINVIWVSELHRRKGIAYKLMEALMGNYLYGNVLNTSQIAFSQPTKFGKLFGRSFFGRNDFPVYYL